MKSGYPTMLAIIMAFGALALSPVTSAADLCVGKTAPAPSACYSVGKCDPATGEYALIDKTPSTPAPVCKRYTGSCDPATSVFATADIVCPEGQECSPTTGKCGGLDRCRTWQKPQDSNLCTLYKCDSTNGATITSSKTCDTGQECNRDTGECSLICIDNDPKNDETIRGQLTIRGEVSTTDSCTPEGKLVQVGCASDGSVKVYTEKNCASGLCKSGICKGLCANIPPDDVCTINSCDPSTGNITSVPTKRPDITACQTINSCNRDTGYKVTDVVCPMGQECSVTAGGCVGVNKCLSWTPKNDRCNTQTCDPPTGNIATVPVEPPPTNVCQTVKCEPATGYLVANKICPTGQKCDVEAGGCVAIAAPPAPPPVAAAPAQPPPAAAPPPQPTEAVATAPTEKTAPPTPAATVAATPVAPSAPVAVTEAVAPATPAAPVAPTVPVVPIAAAVPTTPAAPVFAVAPATTTPPEPTKAPTTPAAPDTKAAESTDCPLRARRICANAQQIATSDIRSLSDIDIREQLITDGAKPIALDDPAVQQTLKLVGENFMDPRYAAEYAKDDERSRIAYCIGRVTQFCNRPDAEKNLVSEDCSDPKFATENTTRCPLRSARQSACTGTNSTLLSSTSSLFNVIPKVMSLPMFKAEQLGHPQLMQSPTNPLRQYILLPKDGEVLIIDPWTGLVRLVGIDKGQLYVVKDANSVSTILMVVKSDGIKYFNAWDAVETVMKDAVPIDKIINTPTLAPLTETTTLWSTVVIPAGEQVLSAQPNDKGVIVVTGDATGTPKGIWYFAAVSDATGKFIPFTPETAGHTLRKAIFTPDNGKIAADLVLKSKDAAALQPTIMHNEDILAEPSRFTVLADQEIGMKTLKQAISENWVNTASATSTLNDRTKKPWIDSISTGQMGMPALLHSFENLGDAVGALVIQPNGLDFYKMDNGTIVRMNNEFLSAGTDGEVCRKTIATLAVNTNNWGGKDIAWITDNGGTLSIAFYSNINQAPMIKSLAAEIKTDGIQLNATTATEEGELQKCKWEAFQIKPEGLPRDVTKQIDQPDTCGPIFKFEAAPTTANTYLFRFTSTDPLGLTASAQEMVQVPVPTPGATPEIKIMNVEMLTPTQTVPINAPVANAPALPATAPSPVAAPLPATAAVTVPAQVPAPVPTPPPAIVPAPATAPASLPPSSPPPAPTASPAPPPVPQMQMQVGGSVKESE